MTEAVAASSTPAAPVASTPAVAATTVTSPAPSPSDLTIGGETTTTETPAEAPPAGPVVVEYSPTGDAGLDMALDFVGKLGFAPTDPAMKAAEKGDFGLMKAKLAALGPKAQGYEAFIALAEKAHTENTSKASTKLAKDVENIHGAVGGADAWKAISKWAGENATPEEKADVNAALKNGGVGAKAMALWLAEKYSKAKGTTVTPKAAVKESAPATSPAAASSGALTAAQYSIECQKARQSLGYKFDGSKQYADLQARRNLGKKQGL